jgi:hypothetical protein
MLEMAQALSAFGASDAFLMFKRHFHGDNPLTSELQKPSIAMRVPITSVKLEEPWTVEQKAPLSAAQKAIRAYKAKKKKGRRGCCILTLRSKAVAEKWAALALGA